MTTWPLAIAATASRTPARTIRRWIDNGVIKLKRGVDTLATGSGFPVGLSRARIIQVALIREFLGIGMSRSAAAKSAATFANEANCELFPLGKTLLVLDHSGARMLNAAYDGKLTDIMPLAASSIITDCGRIVASVDEHLFSNPKDIS